MCGTHTLIDRSEPDPQLPCPATEFYLMWGGAGYGPAPTAAVDGPDSVRVLLWASGVDLVAAGHPDAAAALLRPPRPVVSTPGGE
jgi:hypothetical protein